MKIAITGATGFIGQHVLKELTNHSVEIIAIVRDKNDALPTQANVTSVHCNTHDIYDNSFEYIGNPDVLIHLAWEGLPNYQSLHHFESELPAQYRFLKSLIDSGLKNLVVTGTCFEYGMRSGQLNETMDTNPSNPYGFSKDMLRRQLLFLQNDHTFTLTWSRLFYLFGEGQSESSLFSQLQHTVERGDTLFNMSGGEQLRDYLPVTQVAQHIVSLALKQRDFGVVNICCGNPISVRNLVERWIAQKKWSIKLNLGYYPYPDYEPMAFWGDRQKLIKCLEL